DPRDLREHRRGTVEPPPALRDRDYLRHAARSAPRRGAARVGGEALPALRRLGERAAVAFFARRGAGPVEPPARRPGADLRARGVLARRRALDPPRVLRERGGGARRLARAGDEPG